MAQKKPGFLERIFSWKLKTNDHDCDDDDEMLRWRYKQGTSRRHTFATAARTHRPTTKTNQQQTMADNEIIYEDDALHSSKTAKRKCSSANTSRSNSADTTAAVDGLGLRKPRVSLPVVVQRQRKVSSSWRWIGQLPRVEGQRLRVDVSRPLEFPATPETILEYHKEQPILDETEEWLMVELNQFQCLVDSMDVIKIIAKHSKFFEVGPEELWDEFFEFVDAITSYDEVINFDVWQEFRDKRYAC